MSDVTSYQVTGDWRHVVDDGMVDLDDLPDEALPTGSVKFTPVGPELAIAGDPAVGYTFEAVTALVAAGQLRDLQGRTGVRLAGAVGGESVRWRAQVRLSWQGQEVAEWTIVFDLDGDLRLSAERPDDGVGLPELVVSRAAAAAERAVAAAGRAEAAAGNVDDAIAGAADVVVQAVEQDRVAAEAAAGSAASSASAADVSAGDAAAASDAAAQSASDAAGSASDADGARNDVRWVRDTEIFPARDAAAGSAFAAAGSAESAGSARDAAVAARAGAEAAEGRARDHAESFGVTAEGVTGAPGSETTVQVSGDGPAYHLVVTTPRGDEGEQGPPGEVSQAALDAAVATLVDNAPEALNTLSELADALGGDPNFATTTATAIGERAKIDGAPAAYNTLGKLVSALIAGDLGGSTDAGVLTGALTDQVDVTDATFTTSGVSVPIGLVLEGQSAWSTQAAGQITALESGKSDVGHTHPVSDLTASGTASSTTYLRGDGTWQTPANTTYAVPTQAEAEAGTATTGRAFSAQRVAQAAIAASGKKDWQGTQAQYNALPTKDADRTYWIV